MEENEQFLPLKQNATTNYLARFSTKNKKEVFKENNNIYETKYGKTEITISYDPDLDEVPDFYVGCQKLQRFYMCKLTEKGFSTNTITLSVKEMLYTMCLPDNKRSRAEIRQNLKTLQNTTINFVERVRNKTVNGSCNIISGWRWSSGYIQIEIPQILIDILEEHGWIMKYPVSNFRKNTRSLLSFAINDKINEVLTKENGVISCRKLYECAVAAGMKEYEYISDRKKRKSFSAAIVKPIENALNEGSFYSWKYRKHVRHNTFNDWLDDYVEVSKGGVTWIPKMSTVDT